ncbi:MAG: CPBP family glutamic-type intramembrane protease [Bacteroidota bacterium]
MKNNIIRSLIVIAAFLLIHFRFELLESLGIDLQGRWLRYTAYHLSGLLIVLLVTAGLFGEHKMLSALGLQKGLVKGTAYGLLFCAPMLFGYAFIGQWQGLSLLTALTVFIGAAMEEVIFRGFLFGLLYRFLGWRFLPAAMLSALIFGSAHLYQGNSLEQTIGVFAVTLMGGVWFSWLYSKWNNNLWIAISLHFFMNLSWQIFAIDTTALGGGGANLFRIMTIAFSIVFTIAYLKQRSSRSSYTKKIMVATLLCLGFHAYGQDKDIQKIEGTVATKSGEPLAYANIGIVGTSTGTVATENGQFTLYLPGDIQPTDTLRCSMIGYGDASILVTDLSSPLNISLPESVVELEEILVKPRFSKRKQLGIAKLKGKRNVNFSISKRERQNLGAEIGRKFKPKKMCRIEKVRFYIRSNNFSQVKFRLLLYNTQKGRPHKYLSEEDIIVTIEDQGKGWIETDISQYNIITDETFVCALQWIDASKDGNILAMPIRFPLAGSTHFYKYGSQAKWLRFFGMSSLMNVSIAY